MGWIRMWMQSFRIVKMYCLVKIILISRVTDETFMLKWPAISQSWIADFLQSTGKFDAFAGQNVIRNKSNSLSAQNIIKDIYTNTSTKTNFTYLECMVKTDFLLKLTAIEFVCSYKFLFFINSPSLDRKTSNNKFYQFYLRKNKYIHQLHI